MNSPPNEDKPLEQSMDVSLEKEKGDVLAPDEEEAAKDAESEMKKQVTVLGEKRKSMEHAEEQIVLSTRSTAENWKTIIKESRKLAKGRDLRAYRQFVQRVAYAKEHCSDEFETLMSYADTDATAANQHEARSHGSEAAWAVLDIQNYLGGVHDQVVEVHTQLLMLSGRNQADPSHSATSSGKRSHSEFSDPDHKKDLEVLPERMERDTLGRVQYEEELKRFGSDTRAIGDFGKLQMSHQEALRSLSGGLEDCLERATIFNDNKRDRTKYKEDLLTLESVLRAQEKTSHNLLIPGPLAEEEPFAQPYLLAVLQALGSVVDKVEGHGLSPAKTMIQTNHIVPSTKLRPKRVADKSIAANSRYIFMLRGDSVEIPVEEKPGQRRGIKPEHLRQECTDQVLSHIAKQVGIAFNFAGIGIDARATGVVLTAAYVIILQLRLENTGTADMKLTQLKTKCMPLSSKTSFEKWVEGHESEWETIKQELYADGMPDNSAVPSGLVALWNLMTSSRSVLVGPSRLCAGVVGHLVGFGSFATVHSAKDNDNHVIKISRYGAKATLDRESSVLRALQQQNPTVAGISNLVEAKEMSVTVGGVDVQLPALILAPRGISVEMHLARDNSEEALLAIGRDLKAALESIHARGYNHNDVSPKNILFNPSEGKVFLIDFGLASSHSGTIKGFCGTPRYAHREVYRMYPRKQWKPKPEFDKSSLAFSMAVLSNHGKHLWKSFQPSEITEKRNTERKEDFNSWAEKRSTIAWSCLEEKGFTGDWKTWCFDSGQWLGACRSDGATKRDVVQGKCHFKPLLFTMWEKGNK